ncbi:MAG: DUF4124 domain-containing protein [Burkholderiales bacterium]|nr:DUF4124 domain-containing protein [Burkholderiales bacterium]
MRVDLPHIGIGRSLLIAAACAASWSITAAAEVYKWVDERGVVNYSGTPPGSGNAAKAMAVPERVSSYTPPPMPRPDPDGALRERIGELEQALRAERMRRQQDERAEREQRQRAHDECVLARRVDCERIWIDPLGTPERVIVIGPVLARPAVSGMRVGPAFLPAQSRREFGREFGREHRPLEAGPGPSRRDFDRPHASAPHASAPHPSPPRGAGSPGARRR